MNKQAKIKICKDHLNYLTHLQQRQDQDQTISAIAKSIIDDHMQDDEEWQHLNYLRSLRNE